MVRVVKTAAVRQDQILDIAEALFLQRGYDLTPIQAIIDAAGIAKGTFYHHYASKTELLDAVVQRYTDRAIAISRAISEDPSLDAAEKLHRVFLRTGAWKTEQRAVLIEVHRALNKEANAALYTRIQRDGMAAALPDAIAVVEQGVAEGLFNTPYPRQAARMLMELAASLSTRIGAALLATDTPQLTIDELDAEIIATQDAIDRLLGVAPGKLQLFDRDALALWLADAEQR